MKLIEITDEGKAHVEMTVEEFEALDVLVEDVERDEPSNQTKTLPELAEGALQAANNIKDAYQKVDELTDEMDKRKEDKNDNSK